MFFLKNEFCDSLRWHKWSSDWCMFGIIIEKSRIIARGSVVVDAEIGKNTTWDESSGVFKGEQIPIL